MKIKEKGHTLLIKKNEGSLAEFITKINSQYETLKKHNLVIDLLAEAELDAAAVAAFAELAARQSEAKKSFVLVSNAVNYNDFDQELVLVPSIQEAHDIIEMDEIERDLGF
ncbi:ribonuclease Z [Flavobacterium sp. JP2137]|uniref:ribonuclease Z n=1 Tax=Flavobacterium sp. JP2137 TaxID=3414510 RepID=UPI003D2FEEA7